MMENDLLKITLIQSNLAWEDPSANRSQFDKLFSKMATEKTQTDLLILPEMFSTGFSMSSDVLAETMEGDTVNWMKAQASRLETTICGSLIIKENLQYFNRFIVTSPNGDLKHYDKKHLFRMSSENDAYSAGQSKLVFKLNGFRICPQICYDLRFPVWSRNTGDYDLLLYVANWPEARRQHWINLLKARAIENQSYVIGVNRVGMDGNGISYSGDSQCYDFNGNCLVDGGIGAGIIHLTLKKSSQEAYRTDFPAWKDADRFSLL